MSNHVPKKNICFKLQSTRKVCFCQFQFIKKVVKNNILCFINLMDGGIKFIRGSYQNVNHIIPSFFSLIKESSSLLAI